jgi:hypothetical protein
MSLISNTSGRLCNQILRNTIVNILCDKYDLSITYPHIDTYINDMINLGIHIFNGTKTYNTSIDINDNNN